MIGKILGAIRRPKYGIRHNHPFGELYEKYVGAIVTAANENPGRSPYDLLAPKKYSQVRPSTLLRSGAGLWKRIAENWGVANFCARDQKSYEAAKNAAVFTWLAYNEAFMLELAVESGVWETWLPNPGQQPINLTPPTMIFDDRFNFSKPSMPRTELPAAMASELAAAAKRSKPRASSTTASDGSIADRPRRYLKRYKTVDLLRIKQRSRKYAHVFWQA